MKQRSSWLRRFVIWTGPVAGMAVLVVGGFLYWVLATTPGARWALVTAGMQVGGSVSAVSGSVWHGLKVGQVSVPGDAVSVHLEGVELAVQWPQLLQRQLHVQTVSADVVDIAVQRAAADDSPDSPFSMPELPLEVRIDRFAVGTFTLTLDGQPIPLGVDNLVSSLYLDAQRGQLNVANVDLGHALADVRAEADVQLLGLAHPWPFDVQINAGVQAHGGQESVLCARRYLPTLARPAEPVEHNPNDPDAPSCSIDINVAAQGSLEALTLSAQAHGQGMLLDGQAALTPLAPFPLKDAHVDLTLPDASSLHADVAWEPQPSPGGEGPLLDRVRGSLKMAGLNLGQLVGEPLPDAVLTSSAQFDALIENRHRVLSSRFEVDVARGSVWNGQPLHGVVIADVRAGTPGSGTSALTPATALPDWRTLVVKDVDIDVELGNNHVRANGAFGEAGDRLALDVAAPVLAAFWHDLPGGVHMQAQIEGAVSNHAVQLEGRYTPDNSEDGVLGRAPVIVNLDARGGWGTVSPANPERATPAMEGWAGQINELHAAHAGLVLQLSGAPSLRVAPGAAGADGLWQVGASELAVALDGTPVLQLVHEGSSGGMGGQWATAGRIERLVVSPELIENIQRIVARVPGQEGERTPPRESRGGVKVQGADALETRIGLAMNWDVQFDEALSGTASVRHLDGDLTVPAQPPFALGLQVLNLDVAMRPQTGGVSRLDAVLAVVTADMGHADINVSSRLRAVPGGGFSLDMPGTTVAIDANIDDLGWVSLFTGDAMEFGGHLHADVTMEAGADGQWDSRGTITGTDVRIVRIDDGIRLLDGTLMARLENDLLILERLEFPARLRVEPKEWRTAEWVSTNPDAQGGYLRLTGQWRFSEMAGGVDVALYRYPVLQRADRYAMVTGDLHIEAKLPAMSITGRVEADAGWIDLDMLGGIPTVDSDVVVIRAGEEPPEVEVPMDISMDIEVDLGPRVYLTGYGVNSGLVGNMRIVMVDNKLTAIGALRTRGGSIEAYGQRLLLRRGTLTFQGDIASPILNIEALRTGYAVEAGVRVSGTARRPVINLVSYPEVSELEKLSWLLFGHGPDESGGDMALLLSVGTALLGDGEPFYRRFGIDELTLQSGDIASAGSILPAESVVSGLSAGDNELERQFVVASKGITRGLTLSIRQALADAGTVGRVSYRLARGLTAELSVGTVNGLALVYRWFSRN